MPYIIIVYHSEVFYARGALRFGGQGLEKSLGGWKEGR